VFTVEERDAVRSWLVARAEDDEAIVGAAYTGSHAVAAGDRWSDTDLILAVHGDLADTIARWTQWIEDEFGIRHRWDLPSDASLVRVFLLPDWVEIDLTFAPEAEFGARGPQWQTIFGEPGTFEPFPAPDRETLIGLLWHHCLHAWICLQRRRWWQAEYWISAARDHTITLACLRLGLPAAHAKGAHLLPDEVTVPLEQALVRELTEPELRRALTAVIAAATAELHRSDADLAAELSPMLAELTVPDRAETG
jgi:hypothetical protein